MRGLAAVSMYSDAYDDYTVELANALAERLRLSLVQPDDVKRFQPDELIASVQLKRFAKPRIRDPRGIVVTRRMVRALVSDSPSVVHIQQSGDPTVNPWLARLPRQCPLVMTVHDVNPHPGDASYRRGALPTQKIVARRVDRFIVHAESLAVRLAQDWNVRPEAISVIPHGELGSLYRRRAAIPVPEPEDNRILFFGRRWAYKGLDVLFEALGDSRFFGSTTITLVVAGRGDAIDEFVAASPAWLRVEIIDRYLSADDVVREFGRAAVCCLPYREASQSGVAALALGMGTPVVASNVGGLGDLLDDSIALTCPPGDARALAESLADVLTEPAAAASRAARGIVRANSDLSWESIAAKHMEAYRLAVGSARSRVADRSAH